MIETATFVCSICGETSTDICVYCTKDTCANHRCLRCLRCSDCCECEVPLTAGEPEAEHPQPVTEPLHEPEPVIQAGPEPEVPEPASAEPLFDTELPPEIPGAAAIVLPEPEPPPSLVEQANTAEELVRALPELFVPEEEEAAEPASDTKRDGEQDASSESSS